MSDGHKNTQNASSIYDKNDPLQLETPNEFDPDLDFLGPFSGYTSDIETEKDHTLDAYLCSSYNMSPFIDSQRLQLLHSMDKKKYGYFIYPRKRAFQLLTCFCESPRLQKEILAFFQLPQHPNRIYFEVESYDFIATYHPCIHIEKVPFEEFLGEVSQMWLSNIMKHLFQEYGRLHIQPYSNDVCQILDVDPKRKAALVRVVPRLNVSKLGYTVDEPKLFDKNLFKENNIKLESKERKIVFSNYIKVMCTGFNGMWFSGGCLLTKVKLINIEYPAVVTDEEKEPFQNKMLLSTSKDPEDSINWNDPSFQKIIKNVKDRNETEQNRLNVKMNKKPPREQAIITVEEKNKIQQEIEKEKELRMSCFELYKPEPVVYEKKPAHMEVHSVNIFNVLPSGIEEEKSELSLDSIPIELQKQIANKENHKLGLLVELPTYSVGVIIDTNDHFSIVLQMDGNITKIPFSSKLTPLQDDGTVKDIEGRRVLVGDTVKVINGECDGMEGIVEHTYNNRVFGKFSDPLSPDDGEFYWFSSKIIVLVADDRGNC